MTKIIDNIAGEILTMYDFNKALKEVKSRVKYHNSEFCYSHRGKHYSQNAYYYNSDGDTFIIERTK